VDGFKKRASKALFIGWGVEKGNRGPSRCHEPYGIGIGWQGMRTVHSNDGTC